MTAEYRKKYLKEVENQIETLKEYQREAVKDYLFAENCRVTAQDMIGLSEKILALAEEYSTLEEDGQSTNKPQKTMIYF